MPIPIPRPRGIGRLNWICDFRSIFEVFTRLSIAIISAGQLFYDNRRRDSGGGDGSLARCNDRVPRVSARFGVFPLPVPSSGKVKNGVPSRMRNDWMVYKRRRGTSSK